MPDVYISLSQAREDVARIVRDDHDIAPPLIRLIKGLTPEDGDPVLYGIGDQLIRELTLLTPEFDDFYTKANETAVTLASDAFRARAR